MFIVVHQATSGNVAGIDHRQIWMVYSDRVDIGGPYFTKLVMLSEHKYLVKESVEEVLLSIENAQKHERHEAMIARANAGSQPEDGSTSSIAYHEE